MTRRPKASTISEAAARVSAEAAALFARLGSPDASADERLAAERWAAQSPENQKAWALAQAMWSGLDAAAEDPAVLELRAQARAAVARRTAGRER